MTQALKKLASLGFALLADWSTHMNAALMRMAKAGRALAASVRSTPGKHLRWLPGQWAFLHDPSRYKMARWGNQWGGKTACGLFEVDARCRGDHPFLDVPPPPIEAWIICASWSQSLAIQKKLWEVLDMRDLDPDTVFDELKGFRGKNPAVKYRNGSIIRIKTTNQGGLNLASATIHLAMFDEPPSSPRIYGEITKRLMKTNGHCLLTMTPINAPCEWIKKLVDDEKISDHHHPFTVENLTPVGYDEVLRLPDGTPCDQDWIDLIRGETLDHEAPIVLDGHWETRVEGKRFKSFRTLGKLSHIVTDIPDIDFHLRIGTDHGSGLEFSAVTVLVGIERGDPYDTVWVIDEYTSAGETTEDQDAEGIADMLIRHGLTWGSLGSVYGDRPWARKGAAKVNMKSNERLARAICRLPRETLAAIGINPKRGLPVKFQTVKRGKGHGAGSVYIGEDYLHKAMVRNCFRIHERCERGIECFSKYDGKTASEYKHWIDGLRYALDDLIFETRQPSNVRLSLR